MSIGCFGLVPGFMSGPAANAAEPEHPAASALGTWAPGTLEPVGTKQPHTNQPQRIVVPANVVTPAIHRDTPEIVAAPVAVAAAASTNADWAKLVLIDAGWPTSENNITVMLQWMASENGPRDWWNRNNPLNNGYGSGGGSGFGSYSDLGVAAENAAANLHRNSGYAEIVSAFASSAPVETTVQAIMGSPWASSHYGHGSHWRDIDVPIVAAPPSAW